MYKKNNLRKNNFGFMIILNIFALIFGVLGVRDLYLYFFFKSKNTLRCGEVIDLVYYPRSIVPLIKYEFNGQEYKFKPNRFLFDQQTYSLGDQVTIFLNPEIPDEFIINNNKVIIYSLLISVFATSIMLVGIFFG